MKTKQEIFDDVARYLMSNNNGKGQSIKKVKSTIHIDSYIQHCVYHGRNGNACAIGHLIPRGSIRGLTTFISSVRGLIEIYGDKLPPEIHEYEGLLEDLQNIHDLDSSWDGKKFNTDGVKKLKEAAQYNNLDWNF
jgi:hypothetical protein